MITSSVFHYPGSSEDCAGWFVVIILFVMSAAAMFSATVRFSSRFAAFSAFVGFHTPSLAGFRRSSRQLFVVIPDRQLGNNFARFISFIDSWRMRVRMRFREVPWQGSELGDALTAVIRVHWSVDVSWLASTRRIFRICAVNGHARNLPLLLYRTNLFEDIFHFVVTLKTYRELPWFAVEGDLYMRLAHTIRGIHWVDDCG